jgi:hypothetical protein
VGGPMVGVFLPSAFHQVTVGPNPHKPVSRCTSTCLTVPGPGGQDNVRRSVNGAHPSRFGVVLRRWLAPGSGDGL